MKIYCDIGSIHYNYDKKSALLQCWDCGRYWVVPKRGCSAHAISPLLASLTHPRLWRRLRRDRLSRCEKRYGE
jgi:hypothetical protein